ncbi:MAG: glycosyl hydrolase family 18 protein [Caulobacteraceae bacterium]|nr:glycosyl hydrolase family 18 protein [Caulobacteraceae bacterium]
MALPAALIVIFLHAAGAAAATFAFYAPWDARSAPSLAAHAAAIDWFAPAWISVTGPADTLRVNIDPPARAALAGLGHAPAVMPVVQNAALGAWDGTNAAALLASPSRRTALLDQLEPILASAGASGVMFDFEDLPASAQPDYLAFLGEARRRYAARRWPVAAAVPADDADWNLAAYGRTADYVVLMAYDEHWTSSPPGPIASRRWFSSGVHEAVAAVPPDKLVIGLASYAYDWPAGASARPISAPDAKARAGQAGASARRDAASGEMTIAYADGGKVHTVWISDAAASRGEIAASRRLGVRNFALWRLGSEDPAIWAALR